MRPWTAALGLILAWTVSDLKAAQATPPFSGTIFLDPDIITEADPTEFRTLVDAGRGERRMYDRRFNDWVIRDAFLFNATYERGQVIEIQVNPEFETTEAAFAQAAKYAPVIGRLPAALRRDVDTVWIHKGKQPFGGGNRNLLIHIGQSAEYEAAGILEETFVHEATHTSLDGDHARAPGWLAAQKADNGFISTYARDHPLREDLAESFLLYMAVRHRRDRISAELAETIQQTMPARMAYLDQLDLDWRPIRTSGPLVVKSIHYTLERGELEIEFTSFAGHAYAVDISTNLLEWTPWMEGLVAEGATTTVRQTNFLPAVSAYFMAREMSSLDP
jgi:hypothetical protein